MRLVHWLLKVPATRPITTSSRFVLEDSELTEQVVKPITTLKRGVAFLLAKHAPSPEVLERRLQTIQEVRTALHRIGGNRFKICDHSLRNYASDVESAPTELMIMDKANPKGFPPGTDLSSLHELHDPNYVARVLMDAGFQVSFQPDRPISAPCQISPAKLRESTTPRPHYQHIRKGHLIYPPQLQAIAPHPFTLTLPGPTPVDLNALLMACSKILNCAFSEFISFLYLWTRSWGMVEFTPTCLALMAIRLVQASIYPERLIVFNDMTTNPDDGSWVLHKYKDNNHIWRVDPIRLDTSFSVVKSWKCRKVLDHLIPKFFQFWGIAQTFTSKRVVSLRPGNEKSSMRRPINLNLEPRAFENLLEPLEDSAHEHHAWRYPSLVVQDPFIKTHNHAEGVSSETYKYFGRQCALAAEALDQGRPLMSLFGEGLPIPQMTQSLSMDPDTGIPRVDVDLNSEIGQALNVPVELTKLRLQTINRVQSVICAEYGQNFRVELFGSTKYGVSTPSSDLDLVIIDKEQPFGLAPSVKIEKLHSRLLQNIRYIKSGRPNQLYGAAGLTWCAAYRRLASLLSRRGFLNVRAVHWATVQIVECKDPATGLDCDINVNDRLGLINTGLITRYCDLLPIVRPMIMYIKKWAKPLGLNSPSSLGQPVTFSSYALVLMTIGLLQSRKLLPNLQAGLNDIADDHSDGIFWIKPKKLRVRCDTRYHLAEDWIPPHKTKLEDALVDWFHYWGHVYRYTSLWVDVRGGGITQRRPENAPESLEKLELVVLDPFIPNKNVTVSIMPPSIELFQKECRKAASLLKLCGGVSGVLDSHPPRSVGSSTTITFGGTIETPSL